MSNPMAQLQEATVKAHVSEILRKLRVSSRTQAVMIGAASISRRSRSPAHETEWISEILALQQESFSTPSARKADI